MSLKFLSHQQEAREIKTMNLSLSTQKRELSSLQNNSSIKPIYASEVRASVLIKVKE